MPRWEECLAKSVNARGLLRPSHNPNTPVLCGVQARAQLASLSRGFWLTVSGRERQAGVRTGSLSLQGEQEGTAGEEIVLSGPQEGPSCTQTQGYTEQMVERGAPLPRSLPPASP